MNNKNLIKKHQVEKEFHDKWATSIKLRDVKFVEAFESPTAIENRYALETLGDLKNKKILDLGCGMGDASIYFAKKGALVYPFDISPKMIKLVNKLAKKHNVQNRIHTKVGFAENLPYKSNYFDYVFGNGILHHTEVSLSLPEVNRVLKPKGKAIFVEPLSHNPIINIYRKLAGEVRTPTEHPLSFDKLSKLSKAKFKKSTHTEFHLFTLLIFVYFFLIDKVSPNKERYWKKIINEGEKIKPVFKILNSLDKIVLRLVPSLGRYFWNTVLVFEK